MVQRSPDDKYFYHIDSLTWSISVFDFDAESGNVGIKRRLIAFEKIHDLSFPDGLAVDLNGHLWMAFFGKAQVGSFVILAFCHTFKRFSLGAKMSHDK